MVDPQLDFESNEVLLRRRVRLFPSDGIPNQMQAERRATSAFLSMIRSVAEFGRSLVKLAGGPIGQIECYSEVPFQEISSDLPKEIRPDGLIRLVRGKKEWKALLEVKVGSNDLEQKQFDSYHRLACDLGIDALITVSNQSAQANGHPPLKVDRRRLKKVPVVHWSWERLLREAELLADPKRGNVVRDADQAWMLDEWIRFVTDPASKIIIEPSLGEHWTEVLKAAQELRLEAQASNLDDVVRQWDGFLRVTAFRLKAQLGVDVQPSVFVRHRKDPEKRLKMIREKVQKTGLISGAWRIPDAVDLIHCDLNLNSKRAHYWISVPAPGEGRQLTRLKWLTKQLKAVEPMKDLMIQVQWDTGRLLSQATAESVLKDEAVLLVDTHRRAIPKGSFPKKFLLQWTTKLSKGRGRSSAPVLSSVSKEITNFYKHVVEGLSKPVEKPPKMREKKEAEAVNSEPISEVASGALVGEAIPGEQIVD